MNTTTARSLYANERGSVGLVLALVMATLAGVAALALDLGAMHVRRSSLQTSADSAALAGANAIISYGSDLTKVRTVILDFAKANLDGQDQPDTAVQASDIVFYKNGVPDTTSPNQVEVTVRRAQVRGNPMELFFGKAVNVNSADISAKARAGVVTADSSRNLKPWSVATKFTWNDYADCRYSGNYGNGVLDVDSAKEMASVVVQGYGTADLGVKVVLKVGDPHDVIVPSQYNAIDYPPLNKGVPVVGAAEYRENIDGSGGSNVVLVEPGDQLQTEPGDKLGPTKQGVQNLIAQDPGAYWDAGTRSIKGSAYKDPLLSPRVAIIPFYDPRFPPVSGRSYVTVVHLGAVFIEGIDCKTNVTGRYITTVPVMPKGADSGNGMLAVARLIQDSSRGASN
ncbi:MAG: Tad domain-containing protein [Proteobacteria bacterium]|nr:Tad domain-containing protein [Pseudomonadota bacterium]